jgi:hypothetical protein
MIPTIIFIHIPKSAGTTLQRIMERQYAPDQVFTVDGRDTRKSKAEFLDLPFSSRERFKLVKGHMSFGWHRFLPQSSTYVTVLRDPIERIISHYYYVLGQPQHYLHDILVSERMTLQDYVCSGISLELDNGQTRLLAGIDEHIQKPYAKTKVPFGTCDEEMLELAKRNLTESFSIVGLVERFDETLIAMSKAFDWKEIFYTRKKVTKGRPLRDSFSDEVLNIIRKQNQFDIELYRYAEELFGQAMEKQFVSRGEVVMFKMLNRGWARRQHAHEKVVAGFMAYADGNLVVARRRLLSAIYCDPLVVRDLGVVSVLLETLVGSSIIDKYRSWRHPTDVEREGSS